MISINIEQFLKRLKKDAESVALEKRHKISGSNDNGFECLVQEVLDTYPTVIEGTDVKSICHFGHHFPDLDIILDGKKYGVELKSTQKGGYRINGGSVIESTSEAGYEEIYLFFGSLTSKADTHYHIRYKPYWAAIDGVKVTHSPRYSIDMETKNPLFKSNLEYERVREGSKEEKIRFIQDELRKTAEGKWYAPPEPEKEVIQPIPFSTLSPSRKSHLISEALALFPQYLLSKKGVYDKINEYYLAQYFVFNSSMRDSFSAGGKFSYGNIKFPQIVSVLRKHKKDIKQMLNNPTPAFIDSCHLYWTVKPSKDKPLFDTYCENLDILGKMHLSDELSKAHKTLSQIVFE